MRVVWDRDDYRLVRGPDQDGERRTGGQTGGTQGQHCVYELFQTTVSISNITVSIINIYIFLKKYLFNNTFNTFLLMDININD